MSRHLLISRVYAIMVAAWMFDFRSESAGQGLDIQLYFLAFYFASYFIFLLLDRAPWVKVKGLLTFFIFTLAYLVVSVISGLLRGQDFYPIARNALTVLIYFTATYATMRVVVVGLATDLRRVLGFLCFGFAVSTFLIVIFFQGGLDLSTVRYQIQGASSIAALGFVILAFVFSLSSVEIAAAMAAVIVSFLSITRTNLVVLAAQGLVLFPVYRRFMRPRLIIVLVIIGIAVGALLVIGDESVNRWMQRLTVRDQFGGIDPTLLSRQVEWKYMWIEFLSSADKFLFGAGLAAETAYWIPKYLGGGDFVAGMTGFGHNQHISLLFTAGVIGGAPLLCLQFWQGWQGFRFFVCSLRYGQSNPEIAFLGVWGATIIIGTLAMNFLSSAFALRGFALWYGIGTGLLLGARAKLMHHAP